MRYNWFRFYHDTPSDPKIRFLPVEYKWLWTTVLCMASSSKVRGAIVDEEATEEAIKDRAGFDATDDVDVGDALQRFASAKMLTKIRRGWRVRNFGKRNYDFPSALPSAIRTRVSAHRLHEKKRESNDNVTSEKRVSNSTEKRREEKKLQVLKPSLSVNGQNELDTLTSESGFKKVLADVVGLAQKKAMP